MSPRSVTGFLTTLKSPWLLTGNPGLATTVGNVDRPDAVLARTNAGAVAAVFDAFDAGRTVALVGGGRTIEEIAKAARDLQAGHGTKHPELSRFADWDAVLAYVEDDEHAQSLRAFVRLVDRRGADQLIAMAHDLIDEHATAADGTPGYDVIVSTAHKAKGREWGAVRIAEDFPQPKEDLFTSKVQLPAAEELRLAYVSVTRAKRRLELGSLSWITGHATTSLEMTTPQRSHNRQQTTAADIAPVDADTAPPGRRSSMGVSTPAAEAGMAAAQQTTAMPASFSELETAEIRNAVADHTDQPEGTDPHIVAMQVSAHLSSLIDRHGAAAVEAVIAATVIENPLMLGRTVQERDSAQYQRRQTVEGHVYDAMAALQRGEVKAARQSLDQAERLDPAYRPGRRDKIPYGVTWDRLRSLVDAGAPAASGHGDSNPGGFPPSVEATTAITSGAEQAPSSANSRIAFPAAPVTATAAGCDSSAAAFPAAPGSTAARHRSR